MRESAYRLYEEINLIITLLKRSVNKTEVPKISNLKNKYKIHKKKENVIFDDIDYQIPVTQPKRLKPRLHTLFAYN